MHFTLFAFFTPSYTFTKLHITNSSNTSNCHGYSSYTSRPDRGTHGNNLPAPRSTTPMWFCCHFHPYKFLLGRESNSKPHSQSSLLYDTPKIIILIPFPLQPPNLHPPHSPNLHKNYSIIRNKLMIIIFVTNLSSSILKQTHLLNIHLLNDPISS